MAVVSILDYLAVQNGNHEMRVVPDSAAVAAIHWEAVTGPERSRRLTGKITKMSSKLACM
jgi:hypothetical protein